MGRSDGQDLQQARRDFVNCMQQFMIKSKSVAIVPKLNVYDLHTWQEVEDIIEQACKAYEMKGKTGSLGRIRGLGRKIVKYSSKATDGIDGQGWLSLLPTGDYSGILCGGLKLVFGVGPPGAFLNNLNSLLRPQKIT